jgi:hypothetical protein
LEALPADAMTAYVEEVAAYKPLSLLSFMICCNASMIQYEK